MADLTPLSNEDLFQHFAKIAMRTTLVHLLLKAGGQVELFPEDMKNATEYQMTVAPLSNPERFVVSLVTHERFEELSQTGVPVVDLR